MIALPLEEQASVPETVSATRPMYWSIRRELWENRSLTVAPALVAAVFLLGFLMSTITLPRRMRTAQAADVAQQRAVVERPYDMVAGFIVITAMVVGIFYCLDALHGERRDRSILFWKSLPVSDRTTVLSKAAIPLVILPAYAFVLSVIAQTIVFFINNAALLGDGKSLAMLWTHLKFVQLPIALLYGLVAIALWQAPIHGWLLLISVWARRGALVWSVLPFAAAMAFEAVVFNTHHIANFVGDRFGGFFLRAFVQPHKGAALLDPLASLTPARFLATPSLWIGLLFAAAFLAAAVRLRRYRSPL